MNAALLRALVVAVLVTLGRIVAPSLPGIGWMLLFGAGLALATTPAVRRVLTNI